LTRFGAGNIWRFARPRSAAYRQCGCGDLNYGGKTKLSGPQGGLAFDLEGTDCAQLTIPPSPKLASAERAGEMIEDYWMALARDVPFSQYGQEPITAAAIAELNTLSHFAGPKVSGHVTAGTLFRGTFPGELIGPILAQFFLMPVTFGTLSITQKFNAYLPGTDYLTNFSSWLAVQNGRGPFPANMISGTSYIKNGRDLGAWLHSDITYQAYLFAAQWLLTHGAPFNPGNPYLSIANQRLYFYQVRRQHNHRLVDQRQPGLIGLPAPGSGIEGRYSSSDALISIFEQWHDGSLPGHSRFPSRLAPCANSYLRPFRPL
jgi:hypothetical protein